MNIVGLLCNMRGSKYAIAPTLQSAKPGAENFPGSTINLCMWRFGAPLAENLDLIETPPSSCFLFVFLFVFLGAHLGYPALGVIVV